MELTRERMLDYLRDPKQLSCTVRIRYTTIVQKSYGVEKRFFVPAPIISLEGNGWVNKIKQLQLFNEREALLKKIDVNRIPVPYIEGAITVHEVAAHPVLSFDLNDKVRSFLAKSLYIRHTENRNYLQMAIEMKYNNGCRLGVFLTDRVKVISKASKAKNSTANIDFKYLSVSSGQEICLSNRPKAPPVTRFIIGEDKKFSYSTTTWSPLKINAIYTTDDSHRGAHFRRKEGPIHYGDVVRLVSKDTGMSLPPIRICKVNKDKVVFPSEKKGSEGEVLNQMQKVVLQMADQEDFSYLQLGENGISINTIKRKDPKAKEMKMHETALFTIYCTEQLEYNFYEAMGPTMYDVLPAPICYGIALDKYNVNSDTPMTNLRNYISGKNFTDDLSVWVGSLKCKTFFCGLEKIEFLVPSFKIISSDESFRSYFTATDRADVPINLVRDDGVIFATGFKFSYDNTKAENTDVEV